MKGTSHIITVMFLLACCPCCAPSGAGVDVQEDAEPDGEREPPGDLLGDVDDIQTSLYAEDTTVAACPSCPSCDHPDIEYTACSEDEEGRTACYYVTKNSCKDHSECSDGVFCNTQERCGMFLEGIARCYLPCCPPCTPCDESDDPVCRPPVCLEEQRACIYPLKDSDGDGYIDERCVEQPDAEGDCDDEDPDVHPGKLDACDGEDNNCNGIIDEDGWDATGGDAEARRLSSTENPASLHAAAPGGGGWCAAWLESGSEVRFADVAEDGSAAPKTIRSAGDEETVGGISILEHGGECYVAWSETSGSGTRILVKHGEDPAAEPPGVIYSTVTTTGEIAGDVKVVPWGGSTTRAGVFFKMGVGGDGGNYEIFYLPVADFTQRTPVLLDETGPRRLTSSLEYSGGPDAARIDGKWLTTWEDARDGDREIYVMTLDFAGSATSDATRISSPPGDSEVASVACLKAEGECAVTWIDERYGPFTVFATIVDADGGRIAPESALTDPSQSALDASILEDPARGQFFVAYSLSPRLNRSDIYIAVSAADTVSGYEPAPIQEGDSGSSKPLMALTTGGLLGVFWLESAPGRQPAVLFKILSCNS